MNAHHQDRSLLHEVIDSLPQDVLDIVYRMFEGFINDYVDSQMSGEELEEHENSIAEIDAGDFVDLSALP